eukprot:scaffold26111_cov112-Isochrysis_galbana.AAC.6
MQLGRSGDICAPWGGDDASRAAVGDRRSQTALPLASESAGEATPVARPSWRLVAPVPVAPQLKGRSPQAPQQPGAARATAAEPTPPLVEPGEGARQGVLATQHAAAAVLRCPKLASQAALSPPQLGEL